MEAEFNLRKWRTNSIKLRGLIEKDDLVTESNGKLLGIRWNEDEYTIKLGVKGNFETADGLEPTKRNVLNTIASMFDPPGYLQPIVIMLKILFQEIFLTKLNWDDRLDPKLEEKWAKVVKSLRSASDMLMKRCY